MSHVLLIEDNPGDATLIRELYKDADVIGDEHIITHVTRTGQAIAQLKVDSYDLIISDLSLPDTEGLDTLKQLIQAAPKTPVILMTGTNNETFITAALNLGAQDYLIKGATDPQVLARATTYAIERKKAENKINQEIDRANVLGQQNDELMLLNKAKDDFISLASHQLRTPATVVKQYLGVLLEGLAGQEVSSDLRGLIQIAYDNNDRQLKIINDLLKTAQLDAGYISLKLDNHSLTSLIRNLCNDFQSLLDSRDQTIHFVTDIDYFVRIDVMEMKIAISNLIENASKYSRPGTTITIDIRKDNRGIIVSITDQGVGIHTNDIPQIFNRFSRIDNEMSDTVEGNGLGLYFVNKIILLHSGNISVESEINKGTTFKVRLPL